MLINKVYFFKRFGAFTVLSRESYYVKIGQRVAKLQDRLIVLERY